MRVGFPRQPLWDATICEDRPVPPPKNGWSLLQRGTRGTDAGVFCCCGRFPGDLRRGRQGGRHQHLPTYTLTKPCSHCKTSSSPRDDRDTGESSGPPHCQRVGRTAPSPSPWPTYRAPGGSLLAPPSPSTQLRVQTCLASNLSPGLAQPSSGLLFLAQLTNCFVTLGKSPCRLTRSVRTEVAREKQALWTPRHLEVTPCLSSQVVEEPWEGCLHNTWRPSARREPRTVVASDAPRGTCPRGPGLRLSGEGGHTSPRPGETGPPGSQVTLRVVQGWPGS